MSRRQRRTDEPARWSIAWMSAPSPLAFSTPPAEVGPAFVAADVTDVEADFVADPFLARSGERWHLFMEVLEHSRQKGSIGHATSRDGRRWRYGGIVLREEHHLSYPLVFSWRGAWYMLPEALESGAICLYRAVSFPRTWTLEARLVEGAYADPTIVRHRGLFWIFACATPDRNDELAIFWSSDLRRGWRPHARNPVIAGDAATARPAGRIVRHGRRLIRFAQDCAPRYGSAVNAFEIVELTPTSFREVRCAGGPLLGPGAGAWNRDGMHHIDPHRVGRGRWVACVDGHRADS